MLYAIIIALFSLMSMPMSSMPIPVCVAFTSAASEQGFEDYTVSVENSSLLKTHNKNLKENAKNTKKGKLDKLKFAAFQVEKCETNVFVYIMGKEKEEISRTTYGPLVTIYNEDYILVEIHVGDVVIALDRVSDMHSTKTIIEWLDTNAVAIQKALAN